MGPLWRGLGSSPRVRGKEVALVPLFLGGGIIPAGAGKRGTRGDPAGPSWDHPRGCGDKRPRPRSWRPMRGSSPRVRGKGARGGRGRGRRGIIPAGAGKSMLLSCRPRAWRDHPRGCGEKVSPRGAGKRWGGSSPRVRGKGLPGALGRDVGRIIPAGAGKSLGGAWRGRVAWDHPRGCGEKVLSITLKSHSIGSSPRVRGKE